MKKHTAEFFKALGATIVIMLFLAILFAGIVDALAPRLIPDWMRVVSLIVSIPFWIFLFGTIAKERRTQKKAKGQEKKKP